MSVEKYKFVCNKCAHPCKLTIVAGGSGPSRPTQCPIELFIPDWERKTCPTCGKKA